MSLAPCDMIGELTQSIVAVLVIVGSLVAALSGSVHTVEILPFAALVLGYYFGRQTARVKLNGDSTPKAVQ